VPGEHRVPIRAKAGGPDNRHIKKDVYYIRRPGPESAPPQSAGEWNALIQRCVRAAKNELADLIRAAIVGVPSAVAPTASARLAEWAESSEARLKVLVARHLDGEEPGRYDRGVWTFSYAFEEPFDLSLRDLMDAMRRAHAPVTGWPAFLVMTKDSLAPYAFENTVESWIREEGDKADGSHSDFWRVSPDGRLFLLRGYQEDGDIAGLEPGTALDRVDARSTTIGCGASWSADGRSRRHNDRGPLRPTPAVTGPRARAVPDRHSVRGTRPHRQTAGADV